MSLNQLAALVHQNAKDHGFHEEPISEWWPKMLLNLIGEISEVWEADRGNYLHRLCDKSVEMERLGLKPLTFLEEEYADIIIRTLDQCARLGIDIERAVDTKHTYNKTRPHKHGKKH